MMSLFLLVNASKVMLLLGVVACAVIIVEAIFDYYINKYR